jgi:hypothetical protein
MPRRYPKIAVILQPGHVIPGPPENAEDEVRYLGIRGGIGGRKKFLCLMERKDGIGSQMVLKY